MAPLPPITLSPLQERVLRLKKEKNAVLLAHNYQVREIQEVADFVGDSLGLSYQAKATEADWIVFCGVHFMAETAKIVNPAKRVIIPDLDAGCSLADSCPPEKLAAYLDANRAADGRPLYVVSYINCTAGVKALSDVICTSGNAVKIVGNVPADREILFCPDRNLGEWVHEKTGRPMRYWDGNCYLHVEFTHASLTKIREAHPGAPIVAHPECTRPVRLLADEVCSTEKMVHYCRDNPSPVFIIATESGMLERLRRELPGKTFVPAPTDLCACADCRFMKQITLEKLAASLETGGPEVSVDPETAWKALPSLERMLEWSR